MNGKRTHENKPEANFFEFRMQNVNIRNERERERPFEWICMEKFHENEKKKNLLSAIVVWIVVTEQSKKTFIECKKKISHKTNNKDTRKRKEEDEEWFNPWHCHHCRVYIVMERTVCTSTEDKQLSMRLFSLRKIFFFFSFIRVMIRVVHNWITRPSCAEEKKNWKIKIQFEIENIDALNFISNIKSSTFRRTGICLENISFPALIAFA